MEIPGRPEREKVLRQREQRSERWDETRANHSGPSEQFKRLFRWPCLHSMRLDPVQDVRVENGKFYITGDNPQLMLHSPTERPPAGWVEIAYLAQSSERWMHLTLHIDTGNG